MPTIWGIRKGYTIQPYQKFADKLAEFHEGDRLRIKIDRDRNGKFNALYHVLLDQIVTAINRGPAKTSIDDLKKWVKLKKGWYDVVDLPAPTLTGETKAIEYKSTSFASMGEDEFHRFAVDSCELIAADLAPWIKDSPEWAEAQSIINTILPEAA